MYAPPIVGRDTEERVIAYSLVIVASVAAIGWFTWIVTAARPADLLALVVAGSVVVTLCSVPTSVLGIFLLDRSTRDWAMAARSIAIVLVAGVFGATFYAFLWGVDAALLVTGTVVAVVSVWALVPLAVGALSAASGRTSMIGVLLAWPPSNLLALSLFVAPAPGGVDFAEHNVLALDEPVKSGLLLVIVATITFGPALFGRLMDRLITVNVGDVPA